MIRLNDRPSIEQWYEPEQRDLFLRTLERMTEGGIYDASTHGFFLVVEAGEGLVDLGKAMGRDVYHDSWEYVEEHAGCHELVCVLAGSGFGVVVIVPKGVVVDSGLALVCTQGESRWTR